MDIGKEIKSRRKALGLSQKQLAELVGKSPQTVNDMEHGRFAMKVETLLPLVKALGGTVRIEWQ